eukprot:1179467-Prorocentrum_minimum.AAC.6
MRLSRSDVQLDFVVMNRLSILPIPTACSAHPEQIGHRIADPEAEKPEDWDDEDDGEWEAPMIDNPDFTGEWSPKQIDNPDYKGIWEAPLIDNPEYEADENLHIFPDTKFVGFELWQPVYPPWCQAYELGAEAGELSNSCSVLANVKAGTIFDNILVTDDAEYARQFAEDTWGASKEGEGKMKEAADAIQKAEEDAAREAAEAEKAELDEDEEDDEETDEEFEGDHDEL